MQVPEDVRVLLLWLFFQGQEAPVGLSLTPKPQLCLLEDPLLETVHHLNVANNVVGIFMTHSQSHQMSIIFMLSPKPFQYSVIFLTETNMSSLG